MTYYKKSQKEKSINFYAPTFGCFACNVTGLVNNSDGLINLYWGSYTKMKMAKGFTVETLLLFATVKGIPNYR